MKAQRDFVLRIPATNRGRAFIDDLRSYLNTNTYKLERLRYTGKRAIGDMHTKKEDAKTIRVYLKDKRMPIATNITTLMHEVEYFRHRAETAEKKLEQVTNIMR